MTQPIRYHFFRNATAKLTYAGTTFLLDPMLSDKGALPSFAGVAQNPTVDLPTDVATVIADIDAVIVSHMHGDHFDGAAAQALDKSLPVLTPRNGAPSDKSNPDQLTPFIDSLQGHGFTDVTEIGSDTADHITFRGITIRQVFARHGKGKLGELMGGVNGLILSAEGHPTLYWAGDTILDDKGEVAAILAGTKPDVVIAHSGGPVIEALSPDLLLMDAAQTVQFTEHALAANPQARIIAIHMDALDHCFSTRADLQEALQSLDADMRDRVIIPGDGDVVTV
ncbi:MBL fold metallo-hydrolase [Sulfitobacter sp. S190]|uniref:MBL fold metallo-hydrolase n=1 Tax=Sulfitobacter sp. S190 TaxID=2867022 RepID=UPI0021A58B7C|nr:MBL fold metallo-hydrolase [Sulfitobacter sp. S190]UWR22538.1 MBL fold metallo-hydrolase [Sulfitobacter sp. S190]